MFGWDNCSAPSTGCGAAVPLPAHLFGSHTSPLAALKAHPSNGNACQCCPHAQPGGSGWQQDQVWAPASSWHRHRLQKHVLLPGFLTSQSCQAPAWRSTFSMLKAPFIMIKVAQCGPWGELNARHSPSAPSGRLGWSGGSLQLCKTMLSWGKCQISASLNIFYPSKDANSPKGASSAPSGLGARLLLQQARCWGWVTAVKPAERSCHNSDGLTTPGHAEADVKQGTIQVKREYIYVRF